jgi:hypothetical protein
MARTTYSWSNKLFKPPEQILPELCTFVFIRKLVAVNKCDVAETGCRSVAVSKFAFAVWLAAIFKTGFAFQNFIRNRAGNSVPANGLMSAGWQRQRTFSGTAGAACSPSKRRDLCRNRRFAARVLRGVNTEFFRRENLFDHCAVFARRVGVGRIGRVKHLVGDDHRVARFD